MSSATDLRQIALAEFATSGFAGTSIARIGELAGLSKSSVLYHYVTKEALLEAAIGPAIEKMTRILERTSSRPFTAERRALFINEFVDFLLQHRLEVHMFINQGPSLVNVPVIDRANELVVSLARYFSSASSSTEEKMRFGIALGGAAYMLCTEATLGLAVSPEDETRAALITIMTELLAPVTVPSDSPSTGAGE